MSRYNGRLFFLAILLVAAVALFTSGTMAFYTQSMSMSADLTSASFELRVNDSPSDTQSLPAVAVGPGESATREVKIDTSRLGTRADLTVTLTATPSGAMPAGLTISLDGVTAVGAGTLTAVRTVSSAQAQIITMPVKVQWAASQGDFSAYRSLSISYQVTVEVRQVTA